MLKIFYGPDRVRAQAEIKKYLGEGYEIIDGEELDLPAAKDIFFGTSLFGPRKILIRNLRANKSIFEKLPDFVATEHQVALWEETFNQTTLLAKDLKAAGVEFFQFKAADPPDKNLVFNIFTTALRDGPRAVQMAEQIELKQDPFMFTGLMISQATRQWTARYGAKEKRVLRELSRLDMQMKSTSISPWTLVKSFLLRVSSL